MHSEALESFPLEAFKILSNIDNSGWWINSELLKAVTPREFNTDLNTSVWYFMYLFFSLQSSLKMFFLFNRLIDASRFLCDLTK